MDHNDIEQEPLMDEPQSCRSEEGITVGLVDAIIGILRVLAPRDLRTTNVQEALADLFQDPDLQTVRDALDDVRTKAQTEELKDVKK